MSKQHIDYSRIPAHQAEIDARLTNWARWCRSGSGGSNVLPMFRGYRDNYWAPAESAVEPIDVPAAVEVQRAMSHVPERHRMAVQWAYVICSNPARTAAALGVSRPGLADLIIAGRDMVANLTKRREARQAVTC